LLNNIKVFSVLKVLIPLAAAAVISRTFSITSYFYYLLPLLFIIVLAIGYKEILKSKTLKTLSLFLFLFGFWCIVTSLWSDYPLITLSRSAYFIFISACSVLCGYLWFKADSGLLSFLLPANIIVIVLSIFSLITNIPADSWTGGHGKGFMGFAGHQNTLASAILFTIPAVINKIPSLVGNKKGWLILLLFLNLLILLLTYSRASILALVCGVIIFLILNKKWNMLIYSSTVILVVFFMIYFSSFLSNKANELIKKDFPAFFSSREWLWEPSYRAALNGGLIGLGYGISDPAIILTGTGSHYEGERYVREKGNSFLALIEEVGIVGLILFLLPIWYLLKHQKAKSLEQSDTSSINHQPSTIFHFPTSIIISILAALTIHAQFEAWMVGVGSIQLPLFFIYFGGMIIS